MPDVGNAHCFATEQARPNESACYRASIKILRWLQDVAAAIRWHKAQDQYGKQRGRAGCAKGKNGLTPQEEQDRTVHNDSKALLKQAETLAQEWDTWKRYWHEFSNWEQHLLWEYWRGNLHSTVCDVERNQSKQHCTFRVKQRSL